MSHDSHGPAPPAGRPTPPAIRPAPPAIRPARTIHVIQGNYHVTDEEDVALATLLGSCVAACIRDSGAGIGGLNHFLLPDGGEGPMSHGLQYGVHAMELLVNGILSRGGRRERLTAKLFGGARLAANLPDIGAKNARFAEDFLRREGIAYEGGSLGGTCGRRIQFWPHSGRARQSKMAATNIPDVRPEAAMPAPPPSAGAIELF